MQGVSFPDINKTPTDLAPVPPNTDTRLTRIPAPSSWGPRRSDPQSSPGIGVLRADRGDGLVGRGLVDVGETHALHGIEMIEITPEFVETMGCRQRVGVVAEVVFTELAGVVAEVAQEPCQCRRAGLEDRTGCQGVAEGSCRCAAGACR